MSNNHIVEHDDLRIFGWQASPICNPIKLNMHHDALLRTWAGKEAYNEGMDTRNYWVAFVEIKENGKWYYTQYYAINKAGLVQQLALTLDAYEKGLLKTGVKK